MLKRNEEHLQMSYSAETGGQILIDNVDDLMKQEEASSQQPSSQSKAHADRNKVSDQACAVWRNISRHRNALVAADKSCTARALPSWWPVYRWNLAYRHPFFLPALTAHACTRIASMAKPLTTPGLERKEKDILRSVCSRWDIDPSTLDKIGAKLQSEIFDTVQMELETFKHKLTDTLIDNSIEARQQLRATCWAHAWVAPGTGILRLI